jgi:hypothetical protein
MNGDVRRSGLMDDEQGFRRLGTPRRARRES